MQKISSILKVFSNITMEFYVPLLSKIFVVLARFLFVIYLLEKIGIEATAFWGGLQVLTYMYTVLAGFELHAFFNRRIQLSSNRYMKKSNFTAYSALVVFNCLFFIAIFLVFVRFFGESNKLLEEILSKSTIQILLFYLITDYIFIELNRSMMSFMYIVASSILQMIKMAFWIPFYIFSKCHTLDCLLSYQIVFSSISILSALYLMRKNFVKIRLRFILALVRRFLIKKNVLIFIALVSAIFGMFDRLFLSDKVTIDEFGLYTFFLSFIGIGSTLTQAAIYGPNLPKLADKIAKNLSYKKYGLRFLTHAFVFSAFCIIGSNIILYIYSFFSSRFIYEQVIEIIMLISVYQWVFIFNNGLSLVGYIHQDDVNSLIVMTFSLLLILSYTSIVSSSLAVFLCVLISIYLFEIFLRGKRYKRLGYL